MRAGERRRPIRLCAHVGFTLAVLRSRNAWMRRLASLSLCATVAGIVSKARSADWPPRSSATPEAPRNLSAARSRRPVRQAPAGPWASPQPWLAGSPTILCLSMGKFALIKHQRDAHAKQFKRANRALRTLRTYLGRVIRDITRKLEGSVGLLHEIALDRMLALARGVLDQKQRQRGPKVYSLHAPEVECIGKARCTGPTSSASRSRSPRRYRRPAAASSSPM